MKKVPEIWSALKRKAKSEKAKSEKLTDVNA